MISPKSVPVALTIKLLTVSVSPDVKANKYLLDISTRIFDPKLQPRNFHLETFQPVTVGVTDIEPTFKVKVPEYRSRFPSTGPLVVFYLGPGSRVQVQVPEYRF